MGLVKGFEHDLFVSYNHADDLLRVGSGWVGAFASKLQSALTDSLKKEITTTGRQLDVFWDYKLDRGQPLSEGLKHKVESSATFLIIMSQHYLESEWCGRECAWFAQIMKSRRGSLLSIEESRVLWPLLVAQVGPTDRRAWPHDLMREAPGYVFHHAEVSSADPRYNYPSPTESKRDNDHFYPEFNRLQGALAARFKKVLASEVQAPASSAVAPTLHLPPLTIIPQRGPSPGAKSPKQAGPHMSSVVLLATDDQRTPARQIQEQLGAAGLHVENGAGLTSVGSSAVIEDLVAKSDALVLLLGISPGDDVSALRFSQALDSSRRHNTHVFAWMRPDLRPEFIQMLPEDPPYDSYKSMFSTLKGQLRTSSLEAFVASIVADLKERAQPGPDPGGNKVSIFLDAGPEERSLTDDIITVLQSREVVNRLKDHKIVRPQYWKPPSESDPQRAHNRFWMERVQQSDGVMIVVYGGTNPQTVDDKIDEIEKLSTIRQQRVGRHIRIALHDGPPTPEFPVVLGGIPLINARQAREAYVQQIVDFIIEIAVEGSGTPAPVTHEAVRR